MASIDIMPGNLEERIRGINGQGHRAEMNFAYTLLAVHDEHAANALRESGTNGLREAGFTALAREIDASRKEG